MFRKIENFYKIQNVNFKIFQIIVKFILQLYKFSTTRFPEVVFQSVEPIGTQPWKSFYIDQNLNKAFNQRIKRPSMFKFKFYRNNGSFLQSNNGSVWLEIFGKLLSLF